MIAMALRGQTTGQRVPSSRLLIADEPTTALDVTVQKQILDLLAQLRRDLGLALLFITHDLGVVAQVADRIAVTYAGRIVEEGPAREVLERPRHPYTAGLLRASPQLVRHKLEPIPGTVPSLTALPPGCAFEPRCPLRIAECAAAMPELRDCGSRASRALHSGCEVETGFSLSGFLLSWRYGKRQAEARPTESAEPRDDSSPDRNKVRNSQ